MIQTLPEGCYAVNSDVKISVVIPVYNEKEAVRQCLEAVLNQDYPKEAYEVIVVNDGSTDGTREVVETYSVRLINLNRNAGRIIAREVGARAAKYELLYFVDARIIPDKSALNSFVRIGYQPNIGGEEYLDKYRSLFDTLFYLVRRKVYKPYYPQYLYEEGKDYYYIDEENFDDTPKGMSNVFISKELFLSSVPEDKGKMVSDDTRLFREIVKKKKILRHSDIRFTYLQRTGFREVMRHIFERGPRFADYYLAESGKHKTIYLTILFCVILFTLSGAFYTKIFLAGLTMLLIINIVVAVWFAENIRDFFIAFFLLPPVAAAFAFGVLKGQIKKGCA